MPLRTSTSKAFHQLMRQDRNNIPLYRAQLRYFHMPQRVVLGMPLTDPDVDYQAWVQAHEAASDRVIWHHDPTPNVTKLMDALHTADRSLRVVPNSPEPTFQCACGETFPDSSLDVGHTYTQCEPPEAYTPTPPHAVPPA